MAQDCAWRFSHGQDTCALSLVDQEGAGQFPGGCRILEKLVVTADLLAAGFPPAASAPPSQPRRSDALDQAHVVLCAPEGSTSSSPSQSLETMSVQLLEKCGRYSQTATAFWKRLPLSPDHVLNP